MGVASLVQRVLLLAENSAPVLTSLGYNNIAGGGGESTSKNNCVVQLFWKAVVVFFCCCSRVRVCACVHLFVSITLRW